MSHNGPWLSPTRRKAFLAEVSVAGGEAMAKLCRHVRASPPFDGLSACAATVGQFQPRCNR